LPGFLAVMRKKAEQGGEVEERPPGYAQLRGDPEWSEANRKLPAGGVA